jgi:hypothetical protein
METLALSGVDFMKLHFDKKVLGQIFWKIFIEKTAEKCLR